MNIQKIEYAIPVAPDNFICFIEIVIGFIPESYTVGESVGFSNFMIEIISGVPSSNIEVVVEFFTEDGSAEG